MFSYSLAILIFLYNCSQSFWAFTTYQIFIQGQTLISISIVIIFTVHFLSYCSKHTPMNVFHSFYCRTCRVSRWRPLLSTLICRWGGQCRAPLEPRAAIMSVGDNAFAAWAPALSCRGQDEHSVLTLSSACLEGLQLLERQCPFMRIPPAKRELVNKLWSVITKKSTRFPPRPPAPFWGRSSLRIFTSPGHQSCFRMFHCLLPLSKCLWCLPPQACASQCHHLCWCRWGWRAASPFLCPTSPRGLRQRALCLPKLPGEWVASDATQVSWSSFQFRFLFLHKPIVRSTRK